MVSLKLEGLTTRFPLDTPLNQNGAFIQWKELATKEKLLKLLSTSLHDTKVMYCVKVNQTINLAPIVKENLEYLARLCGFDEDIYTVALIISEKETNYSAYISEPQKSKERPMKHRESRNHFGKYDNSYS